MRKKQMAIGILTLMTILLLSAGVASAQEETPVSQADKNKIL